MQEVELTPATPKPEPIDVEQVQREIIFEPNPGPQTDFLASTEQEVLYGGSAGGGKSYAMVADPVRYLNNPNARMLLVRRSTEELRELISVSKQLYPKAIPGIKFMERDKTWVALVELHSGCLTLIVMMMSCAIKDKHLTGLVLTN